MFFTSTDHGDVTEDDAAQNVSCLVLGRLRPPESAQQRTEKNVAVNTLTHQDRVLTSIEGRWVECLKTSQAVGRSTDNKHACSKTKFAISQIYRSQHNKKDLDARVS